MLPTTKRLKGLQIGNNIYSQVQNDIIDPELTWSSKKIFDEAYLSDGNTEASITASSEGTITLDASLVQNSKIELYDTTPYVLKNGYIKKTDGNIYIGGSSWTYIEDFIPIPNICTHLYMEIWPGLSSANTNACIAFYEKKDNTISFLGDEEGDEEGYTQKPNNNSSYYEIPPRAQYLRVSWYKNDINKVTNGDITTYSYDADWIKFITPLSNEEIVQINNLTPNHTYKLSALPIITPKAAITQLNSEMSRKVEINDTEASTNTTYSSEKIATLLNNKINDANVAQNTTYSSEKIATLLNNKAEIDDGGENSNNKTWSIQKIAQEITALIQDPTEDEITGEYDKTWSSAYLVGYIEAKLQAMINTEVPSLINSALIDLTGRIDILEEYHKAETEKPETA